MDGIKNPKNRGFSLVEILVAVLIFSIITSALLGVFASAIRGQRHSLAYNQMLDQMSFTMENMSRMLRMARKELPDSPGPNCTHWDTPPLQDGENYVVTDTSIKGILFRNYRNKCKMFFVFNGVLYDYEEGRMTGATLIETLPLTPDDVVVSDFNIGPPLGWAESDDLQPRVTIMLEIKHKNFPSSAPVRIQTTISQRDLDLNEVAP